MVTNVLVKFAGEGNAMLLYEFFIAVVCTVARFQCNTRELKI